MPPLYEARGIVKHYGQIRALDSVDFSCPRGSVVALVGDNGAGKSTLVRILSGAEGPNDGELFFEGQPIRHDSIAAAAARGIQTVYQDLALAPHLDSVANLYLGREQLRRGLLGRLGFLDNAAMGKSAESHFARLGVAVKDVRAPVLRLSGGQRQGVAVGRAVLWASKIVIMDEPTAALGVRQTRNVLDLIRRVRDEGVTVILVSHNMTEVLQVADTVEVLRSGRRVASFRSQDTTVEELVFAMTGIAGREAAS